MNLIREGAHQKLVSAFRAGLSIRAAAAYADVNRKTALRYWADQPPITCPCGQLLPHRFWCQHRVALSPKRQSFLKTFVQVSPATLQNWERIRLEIGDTLSSQLCILSQEHMGELRRFYLPPAFGMENVGDGPRLIAVAEATQENTSFALFSALERLHPAVKRMVLGIIDGASIPEAAAESGISEDALKRVMPPLKVFLRPYVCTTES